MMSAPARIRCIDFVLANEGVRCCEQVDCAPPICDRHLTEAPIRSLRLQFVLRRASLIGEVEELQTIRSVATQ